VFPVNALNNTSLRRFTLRLRGRRSAVDLDYASRTSPTSCLSALFYVEVCREAKCEGPRLCFRGKSCIMPLGAALH
jgi:hypothetical protein